MFHYDYQYGKTMTMNLNACCSMFYVFFSHQMPAHMVQNLCILLYNSIVLIFENMYHAQALFTLFTMFIAGGTLQRD